MKRTSNPKLAKALLHRNLLELSQISMQSTASMLQAWDSGKNDEFVFYAYKAFEQLEDGIDLLLELPDVDEDVALSESVVKQIGRCLGLAIHGFLSVKYQKGRQLAPASSPLFSAADCVQREERRYIRLLNQSRQAALQRNIGLIHQTFVEGLEVIRVELNYLVYHMAGQPSPVKRAGVAAIRTGLLARKYSMFLPACLHIMLRMTNTQRSAGLQQVASRREQLLRSTAGWLTAQSSFPSVELGESKRVVAVADTISWVDGDPGYTSITVSAGAVSELRVPRRNAIRIGISRGSWVFAEGNIRQVDNKTFLETTMIGLTDHAKEVWEDYLAIQVRPFYDLYPRSLNVGFELPDLEALGARNDLFGRI